MADGADGRIQPERMQRAIGRRRQLHATLGAAGMYGFQRRAFADGSTKANPVIGGAWTAAVEEQDVESRLCGAEIAQRSRQQPAAIVAVERRCEFADHHIAPDHAIEARVVQRHRHRLRGLSSAGRHHGDMRAFKAVEVEVQCVSVLARTGDGLDRVDVVRLGRGLQCPHRPCGGQ